MGARDGVGGRTLWRAREVTKVDETPLVESGVEEEYRYGRNRVMKRMAAVIGRDSEVAWL